MNSFHINQNIEIPKEAQKFSGKSLLSYINQMCEDWDYIVFSVFNLQTICATNCLSIMPLKEERKKKGFAY